MNLLADGNVWGNNNVTITKNDDGSVTLTAAEGGEWGFSLPDDVVENNFQKFVIKYKDAVEKNSGCVSHYNEATVAWVDGEAADWGALSFVAGSQVQTLEHTPGNIADGLQTIRIFGYNGGVSITIVSVQAQ